MYPKFLSAGCMLVSVALMGASLAQSPPTASASRSFIFLGFPTKILISGADTANASALLDADPRQLGSAGTHSFAGR
jgi:hypothetical protein